MFALRSIATINRIHIFFSIAETSSVSHALILFRVKRVLLAVTVYAPYRSA